MNLYNYIKINSMLVTLSIIITNSIEYIKIYENNLNQLVFNLVLFIVVFILFSLRNFFLMFIINYFYTTKPNIHNIQRPVITSTYDVIYETFKVVSLDAILLIYSFNNIHNTHEYGINTFILFIPYSFVSEIIFDFFHYLFHYIVHHNKFLYKNFHKFHHQSQYPSVTTTFHQNIFDYILTNIIPMIIVFHILIPFNVFYIVLFYTYKVYIEIGGHCGKVTKTCSFPQFIWLPKFFNIELYTIDHDNHHSKNNCNYSKRFCLWDKIFNTYYLEK